MTVTRATTIRSDPEGIGRAAAILRRGGLVAFPTETVYGLGANALNETAVRALYAAKRRPQFNPLIVHVHDLAQAATLGRISGSAQKLAFFFWPGPLTLVVPRQVQCPASPLVSAGLDTIALRAPSHPVARTLIAQAGVPIAAPSANHSGHLTATTAMHVRDELGRDIEMVLDGGASPLGLESTVVGFEDDRPVLLRLGAVPREAIENLVGPFIERSEQALRSPGQLPSHYAPRALVRLNATATDMNEVLLAFGSTGVPGGARTIRNLSPSADLHEAAANLYTMLRELDAFGARTIAVMTIPDTGLGAAINDRLRRAAAPRGTPP